MIESPTNNNVPKQEIVSKSKNKISKPALSKLKPKVKIDTNLSPRNNLSNIAKEPQSLEDLLRNPNVKHALKQANIDDPRNTHYLDIETGKEETRSLTVEEITDIVHEQNPHNFDLNTPPIDNPDQMLSWLKWRNAGKLIYDDITPPMVQKAVNVAQQLGLPIETLSTAQISMSQDMTAQEIQQMRKRIENPSPDFMDVILKIPGVLNEDEIKQLNRKASEYTNTKSKQLEDPLYMPIDLMKHRQQLPSVIGKHFDAHGMTKGNELRVLNYILSHGVNPDHEFYTCPLKSDNEVRFAAAIGAAGPYDCGPFIVLSSPDSLIQDSGVKSVLVNEQYYEAIPLLTQKFPQVTFIRADKMADALRGILQKSKEAKK